jgi:transposase
VVVVLNEDGDRVSWCRIDNTPANLAAEIVAAGGPAAEVAMEATWGWYWAADVIAECGARLHLAHPLGIAGYENRRVKNDIRDATLLADLLRLGRLPEARVAPPEVRELREAVRYRHLCRRRHRCRYAEDRIMPRIRSLGLLTGGDRLEKIGIIRRLTGWRGRRGACRWGGIDGSGHRAGWCGRGHVL